MTPGDQLWWVMMLATNVGVSLLLVGARAWALAGILAWRARRARPAAPVSIGAMMCWSGGVR